MYFDCSITAATTLDQIREAYRFVVLNKLPHGIQVPGWTFIILTPVSSFKDEVTFVSWSGGQLVQKGSVARGKYTPSPTSPLIGMSPERTVSDRVAPVCTALLRRQA